MTSQRGRSDGDAGAPTDYYAHDIDPELLAAKLPDDVAPLTLHDVTKRYGSLVALRDVTFEVAPGEFHCLAGPNGSGKTTLGKIAAGLTRPTTGETNLPERSVGFGFQDPRFYPDLTVRENVAVFCEAAGVAPDSEWVTTLLSTLRLTQVNHQTGTELSGGFKKKLDLAIAMLDAPPYLWLDEPLTDIDDVSVRRVVSLLDLYARAGGGVVVSTHNMDTFDDALTHLTAFLDGAASDTVVLSDGESTATEAVYQTLIAELRSST